MSAIISTGHRDGTKIAAAAAELNAIHERKGELTPALVVEAARKEESPLHDYFTWSDSKAATNFRLLEAAMLIRSVRVRVTNGEQTIRTNAFMLPVHGQSQYRPIGEVVQSSELSTAMLEIAKTELTAFKKKFGRLEQLLGLWPHIDELLGK